MHELRKYKDFADYPDSYGINDKIDNMDNDYASMKPMRSRFNTLRIAKMQEKRRASVIP